LLRSFPSKEQTQGQQKNKFFSLYATSLYYFHKPHINAKIPKAPS